MKAYYVSAFYRNAFGSGLQGILTMVHKTEYGIRSIDDVRILEQIIEMKLKDRGPDYKYIRAAVIGFSDITEEYHDKKWETMDRIL